MALHIFAFARSTATPPLGVIHLPADFGAEQTIDHGRKYEKSIIFIDDTRRLNYAAAVS
jgi:hypothetical protein